MPMITNRPPVVGDVVYTSWGYDQTNITFYRVLALTPSGKSIRVQQCATSRQPCGSQERVLPIRNTPAQTFKYDDEGERVWTDAPIHTVRWLGDHCKVEGHYAWISDGQAQYATAPGWGH